MPVSSTRAAKNTRSWVPHASRNTTHSTSPVTVKVRRSPMRATIAPAGRDISSWPMPTSATMRAAWPTVAPSSRACSAMIGMIAPCPRPSTMLGPYAGRAMCRRRKSEVEVI